MREIFKTSCEKDQLYAHMINSRVLIAFQDLFKAVAVATRFSFIQQEPKMQLYTVLYLITSLS